MSKVKAMIRVLFEMSSLALVQPQPLGLAWLGATAVVTLVKRGGR